MEYACIIAPRVIHYIWCIPLEGAYYRRNPDFSYRKDHAMLRNCTKHTLCLLFAGVLLFSSCAAGEKTPESTSAESVGTETVQEETELSFEDTDQNAWYYPFLRRAAANQMISGIDETHFGVGQNITRQDMAVMAYRAALSSYSTEETPADRFEDYSKVADYAKDAVNVMVKNGIINGVDSQHFAPDAFATRAQAAKIIYDIYRLLY